MDVQYRPAELDEAEALARIIAETSGGIVEYLLSGLIPGLSALELLRMAVMDEDTVYSYQNTVLATWQDQPVGFLLAYPGEQNGLPETMADFLLHKRAEPLQGVLAHKDQDAVYINTLWVHENWRGSGLADTLMDIAESLARAEERSRLSLHVWADNTPALRFYRRQNFHSAGFVSTPDCPPLPSAGGKYLMHKYLV